jgi:hypothetical protein
VRQYLRNSNIIELWLEESERIVKLKEVIKESVAISLVELAFD